MQETQAVQAGSKLRRSPGEGNGNSPKYSCLENPLDRRAWWATGHAVTETRLSTKAHVSSTLMKKPIPSTSVTAH